MTETMTETILQLLTRLSEAGDDAILPGELAKPINGPVFERLLVRRVLVEQAPLTDWDVCDACECDLPSRTIRPVGDGFRAECPLDRRQDVVLTEDDLTVFRIDAAQLASAIGSAAGFDAIPTLVAGKVWHLGITPSGRAVFLALEPAALAGESIAATIRRIARSDAVTILGPNLPADAVLRFLDSGFHLVETLSVMMPASGGMGTTIDAASLNPVPAATSLRVRAEAAEVFWSGRSVILSHQIFPVFQRLLEKAVRDQVASGSHVEGTTGREAKDLVRELREAFKAVGFTDAEAKSMIEVVRGRGYRLGVAAAEIVVEG
jgi:hypothetical protein